MLLIFDFDNTLEEFAPHERTVEHGILSEFADKYGLDTEKLEDVWKGIKRSYEHLRAVPHDYDRTVWFSQLFRYFHLPEDPERWKKIYWERMVSMVRVFPGTFNILSELREKHTLCILSDSDGELGIKLHRIKQLGLEKYFDHIFTSDSAGHNKPHPRAFLQVLEHYRVAAEQCVMIGDNPPTDLRTSHELGMHTVWLTQGFYGASRESHHDYVDFEADSILELPAFLERLSSAPRHGGSSSEVVASGTAAGSAEAKALGR